MSEARAIRMPDAHPTFILAVSLTSFAAAILLMLQPLLDIQSISLVEDLATWQFVLVMMFAGGTAAMLHRTLIHPYIFFILTSCLFLGGRFFAHAIGFDAPVFFDSGFSVIDLSAREAMNLMALVLPAYLAVQGGYFAYWAWSEKSLAIDKPAPLPSTFLQTCWAPAAAMLAVCIPLGAYGIFGQYVASCVTGDYMSIYNSTSEFATRGVSLAQYGLLLALGLSLASGNRWVTAAALAALGAYYLAGLGLGIRSGFLSFVLLATWIVHKRVRQLNILTMLIVPALMLVVAQGSAAFSCRTATIATPEIASSATTRAAHFTESVKPNAVLLLAHRLGTSLLSINVATGVTDYPWPAYVQTFVPGFGAAAAVLGQPFPLSDLYFGQHMAKTWLEPHRYARGEGFGWSIVSDFHVFSQGHPAIFIVFAAATGAAFAALVAFAQVNAMWFGALGVIVPKIALLPRAGLYSIFPYLVTFLILVAGWWVVVTYLSPRLPLLKQTLESK